MIYSLWCLGTPADLIQGVMNTLLQQHIVGINVRDVVAIQTVRVVNSNGRTHARLARYLEFALVFNVVKCRGQSCWKSHGWVLCGLWGYRAMGVLYGLWGILALCMFIFSVRGVCGGYT